MTLARSILYSIFLYATMTLVGVILLPFVLIFGRPAAASASRLWARIALWGLRVICGTRYEVRGFKNLPTDASLIACKHQSMWETLFFMRLYKDPAIVVKKELLALPIYGWYTKKLGMIAVDREQGPSAIKHLAREASKALADKRPVVIFPEGTRQPPGAPPDYKPGIALLYKSLGVACVPAALNSGLYWEGESLRRHPGLVVIEFLEPIPPGLDRATFMTTLETRIETACQNLREGAKGDAISSQNSLKVADA